LIEILLAMVILAIAFVPMMNAFSPGLATKGGEETLVFTNRARATLTRLSGMDYGTLESYVTTYGAGTVVLSNLFPLAGFSDGAAEAAKETLTFRGTSHIPTVTLTDASGGSGGLYELTVTIEYVTLKTLKADY